MDPAEITRALELRPEDAHNVGDPRRTPAGTALGGSYQATFWRHSFVPPDDSDLVGYLERIGMDLAPHREFLRVLRSTGGKASLYIGLFSEGTNIGMTITHSLMETFSWLGVDLGVDIYAYADNESAQA
jgi:hypothetical protein